MQNAPWLDYPTGVASIPFAMPGNADFFAFLQSSRQFFPLSYVNFEVSPCFGVQKVSDKASCVFMNMLKNRIGPRL